MKLPICLVLTITAVFAADCAVVHGPKILGRDVRQLLPGIQTMADDQVVATAADPGLERWFTPFEVRWLGPGAERLCFKRAAAPLLPEGLEAAMHKALDGHDIRIEIIDYTHADIPDSVLEFRVESLSRPAGRDHEADPVLWRGRAIYDGARSIPIWARVVLSEARRWIEVRHPVARGTVLEADNLELREGRRFPLMETTPSQLDVFTGKAARRTLLAGQVLNAAMVEEAPLIRRGDLITVDVASGPVLLRFDAIAEAGGRLNDIIVVRRPDDHKLKVRIADKAKGIIDADIHARVRGAAGVPGDQPVAGR